MKTISKLIFLIVLIALLLYPETLLAQDPRDVTPTNIITSLAWSPDGTKLATANNSGAIQLWDTSAGALIQTLATSQPNTILTVAWSPDGTKLAATVDENILIWNATIWGTPLSLAGHLDPVWGIAWHPDSVQLASVSYAGAWNFNFFIWNTDTGDYSQKKETFGYIYSVSWNPDGSSLATTGGRNIALWNLSSPTFEVLLNGLGGELVNAKWSPNGELLAAVGDNTRVAIFDIETGTIAHELEGHILDIPDLVYGVDWSPDGTLVASAGSEGTVRVWEVETEQQLAVFEVTDGAYSVAFSPDGTKLAYGTTNGNFEIVPIPNTTGCNATQTVSTSAELVSAITSANSNPDASVICLAAGTYNFTVANNPLNALPKITIDITICSQDGATLTRQSGSPQFRLFEVAAGGKLKLENVTLWQRADAKPPTGKPPAPRRHRPAIPAQFVGRCGFWCDAAPNP